LYDPEGAYVYTSGISWVAMVSLLLSILPNLPGFLITIKAWPASWPAPEFFVTLYSYAWFVGFGLAFGLYIGLRKIAGAK
jgi:NCS1 family nucleobase:cation symporter-1